MAQAAYDLEMFENRSEVREPRIRAVKGKNAARTMNRRTAMLSALMVLVVLVCAQIAGNARITELTGQIQSTQRELVDAQSEYNYLSGQLDSKTSQKNVEQIASSQLGLMKMDKSQITYFSVENEEAIRRPESTVKRITEFLTTTVLSLADYLNP